MTITLTTFIPGTKAKADEVNANFSMLKDAIGEKAAIDGDSNQAFLVADATENKHAVNKSQLKDLSDDLTAKFNKFGTKFCVRSGNTSNGAGALFSYDVYELTARIGGTYGDLVIADYEGTQTTISTAPAKLDLTGNANGVYNVFITPEGELYILGNTIYKQAKRPTMVVNDVWLDTSCEPFNCIKYTGSADIKFLDVPLGSVTFSSGAITAVTTFPFNENGYEIKTSTALSADTTLAACIPNFVMPNYANGVNKSWNTILRAETDGVLVWIDAGGGSNGLHPKIYVGATTSTVNKKVGGCGNDSASYENAGQILIPKGIYYRGISGYNPSLTFYPCLACS